MIEGSPRGLSPEAAKALKRIKKLSAEEQAAIAQLIAKLAEAANRVSSATGDKMNSALSAAVAASKTPALTNEFAPFVVFDNGSLEVRNGRFSKWEFQLTLKGVKPFQTQQRLEALVIEMNAHLYFMKNDPLRRFQVCLSYNGDLPNYDKPGDVVFTSTSLIYGSTNRTRYSDRTRSCKGKRRISQEELLSLRGLEEQPIDVIRAIAGMFRVKKGFPNREDDIGRKCDQGDMFEGLGARGKKGVNSGTAKSYRNGVRDLIWGDNDSAVGDVGVIGGFSPALK
jgi:hypothetical protein